MHRFWDTFLEPVVRASRARVICEVGSRGGDLSRRLLAFAGETGATVHVIDPAPAYDADEWKQEFGDRFVFHRSLSLEALPTIPLPDVVLIDGDHNWYTVFHELDVLERRAVEEERTSPVIALHDVGWPYGRRDLYYDPETIPESHRQPHASKGIQPGRRQLVDGGINAQYQNAVHEGGPRNGVLTAVEDFMEQARREWSLRTVPGLHGLGLLLASDAVERNPELADAVASWDEPQALRAHIEAVEAARIKLDLRRVRAERELEQSSFQGVSERVLTRGRRARKSAQELLARRGRDGARTQ